MVSNAVQALRESLSVGDDSTPMRRGKHSVIENFTGNVAVDPVVVIRPTVVARNKGRGKRLKGGREIAVTMKKPGDGHALRADWQMDMIVATVCYGR
nr:protein FAR1-RELATED SEQUENCE 5-like [Ipomoea trifida]